MDRQQQQVIEGLRQLFAGTDEVFSGIVKSVDEKNATIEVMPDEENTDFVLPVMLRSAVSGLKGIVLIPKKGSEVTFCSIEGAGKFTIINAAELDKVLIDVPEIQMLCDKVIINEGNNGAMVIIQALLDNLNSLKTYVETLKSAVSNGLTTVGESTAASGKAGAAAFNSMMAGQQIQFKQMNNDKVKH